MSVRVSERVKDLMQMAQRQVKSGTTHQLCSFGAAWRSSSSSISRPACLGIFLCPFLSLCRRCCANSPDCNSWSARREDQLTLACPPPGRVFFALFSGADYRWTKVALLCGATVMSLILMKWISLPSAVLWVSATV